MQALGCALFAARCILASQSAYKSLYSPSVSIPGEVRLTDRSFVAAVNAQQGTIRVSGGQFVDDNCNPFYFSGYNTWQVNTQHLEKPTRLKVVKVKVPEVTICCLTS